MRIISGIWRGKKLHPPEGKNIRPTSDKSRQAFFNMLESRTSLTGKTILDVFCGSGALGLEAVSRGAHHAVFIDKDMRLCKKNVRLLAAESQATLRQKNALTLTENDTDNADIVLMDPPYGQNLVPQILEALLPLLKQGCLIAVETEKTFPAETLPFTVQTIPITLLSQKTHGAATLSLLQKN